MKKGTKVWYHKTSSNGRNVSNYAAEAVVNGVKDGNIVLTVQEPTGKGTTREAYRHMKPYGVFRTKAELDDAVVNGVKVWVADRDKLEVFEAEYDVAENRVEKNGNLITHRFSHRERLVAATKEECLKDLEQHLVEELRKKRNRVRELELQTKEAMQDGKQTQAKLLSVMASLAGKNKLLSFKNVGSSKSKRKPKSSARDFEI